MLKCKHSGCDCQTSCLDVSSWISEPDFLRHGTPCAEYKDSLEQRHEAAAVMFNLTGRIYSGCCPKTFRPPTRQPLKRCSQCSCGNQSSDLAGCCRLCVTDPTGFVVHAEVGVCPPTWAKRLASKVAFELVARDVCPRNCRLPVNFSDLSRDGITITRELDESLLGWFREIDTWGATQLAGLLDGNGRPKRRSRVLSPDLHADPDCYTNRLDLPEPLCCADTVKVEIGGQGFYNYVIENGCTLVRTDGQAWPTDRLEAFTSVGPKLPVPVFTK